MSEASRPATDALADSAAARSLELQLAAVQQELARARSDLHNLVNATQIATVFLDRELRVMRYTPAAADLFGLEEADVGRPIAAVAPQLHYPQPEADARSVFRTLVPIEREMGLPGGLWYLTRLLPYRTVEDRIAGVVLSFIDITDRKQAEEMRTWLSGVVGALNDAILSFSMDRTILSWNKGAELVFGYTAREAIGQPLALLAPQARPDQDEIFGRMGEGAGLIDASTVWRRKDGADIHVDLRVAPIKGDAGQLLGGTAIARDVTQARAAAEALRASEERLRLVVENARDYAIFSTDLDRKVTSWNTGAKRLLGYSEKEVQGRLADVIFIPEDRAAGAPGAEARQALAEGRAGDDRVHMRKDGSRFWASGMMMLMRDSAGQAVGFVKILRDQTEQREGEQALKQSQQELVQALADQQRAQRALQEADAAKDRFMAVLSHELRNPLASIASASELLMTPQLPLAALEKAAQVVQRQSRAMKVLLDDLLDVSRLTLGRLTLARRPVGIAAVVESALETTRPLVQAAGHRLSLQLPAQEIEVNGDPLRLSQVVANLVTNAVKYTPEGGQISVSAEVVDGEVVITVTDTGIGMEPAEIDRMFDLFSQGEAAVNRANGGLGIGLALARTIVELHEGWIMAGSAGPGRGSQLRIGLPLLRTGGTRAATVLLPAVSAPVVALPDAQAPLILVADDNGDAAWGMAKLLELSGFRAVLARGGEEALRLAQEHRPAIGLLDIGMPDLSGHEVARRLRATDWGKSMILVAATGWGQEADVRQSLEAGFDAHLTKPLNVGRVKALLDELAAQRRPAG